MGRPDTTGIILKEKIRATSFNEPGDPNPEHVARLDIRLKVLKGYSYKWVQVIEKDTSGIDSGRIKQRIDTLCDGDRPNNQYLNYPFYYLTDQEHDFCRPPRIHFQDQPQTSGWGPYQWKGQIVLVAFMKCACQHACLVKTWQWGFTVENGNKPKLDTLKENVCLWPKTQAIVDDLTHHYKN